MPITGADFAQPFHPAGCPTCGHLACVCATRTGHRPGCAFRAAVTSSVGIECEHGRDVCPICDPCTCDQAEERNDA